MMPSCADFHGLWSLLLRFSSVWAALGQARQLQVACLIPGHYEAGMRGSIDVKVAPTGGEKPPASGMASGEHKH